MMTLSEARKTGSLQEFAQLEQARGVGRIESSGFDALVERVIKLQPQQDQITGSGVRGGSTGK